MDNRLAKESSCQWATLQGAAGGITPFKNRLSHLAAPLGTPTNLHVFVLLVLPVLLLKINYTIIFSSPYGSQIDSFVYTGFQLHLPDFLKSRFGDTYYATRIPWIALGYVANRLLNAEPALYAEHIIVYYLAVFSLYVAVSTIFADRLAAFAAAIILGTNSWFLLAAGWDYVDGSYVAFLLFSVAALAATAFSPHWKAAAVLWGAGLAASITLYILLVVLIPIEIGMFLCLNRSGWRRNMYSVASYALFGAIAAFVCMGCISWLAGGRFIYLLPQITILSTVAGNRFRYDLSLDQWVWGAEWLLVPSAIWIFSMVFVAQNGRLALWGLSSPGWGSDTNNRLWIVCIFCVTGLLLFVAFQIDHFYLLQADDKSRALLPFEWLVLGGALAKGGGKLTKRRQLIYALMVAVIALGPWIAARFTLIIPSSTYFTGPVATLLWIGVGALTLSIPIRAGLLKLLTVSLFFSMIGFGAANPHWMAFPPDPFYKNARLAVLEASRAIGPYNPTTAARFWFDARDPFNALFRDVVSTYLYEYSLINDNFPSLANDHGKVSSIAPGDRIIILTSGGNPMSAADRVVAEQHLTFREVADKEIRRPGIAFRLVVADAILANGIGCGSPADTVSIERMPLASLQPHNGGSVMVHDGEMVLTTPPKQWAYAATAPLTAVATSGVSGVVCVRLQVEKGKLGVGVYARGNNTEMLAERPVEATLGPREIEVALPDLARAGSIVLRSWSPNGESVTAQISSIELVRSPLTQRAVSQP